MRIAFDCRIILDKHPAGIARVVLEFLKKLLAIDRKNEYVLIFDSEEKKDWVLEHLSYIKRKARVLIMPYGILTLPNLLLTPKILADRKIDIYYCPYYFASPFFRKTRLVVTVFDLLHFFYPKLRMNFLRRLFHRIRLAPKLIFRRAYKIITISVNTSRDLVKTFHVPPKKIKLVYMGVSEHFRSIDKKIARQLMQDKFRVHKDYFLYVGRNEPHKNIKAIVAAYHFLPSYIKEHYVLVIAGKEDERYSKSLHAFIEKCRLSKEVVFTGYVDDSDLPYIYSGATAFVFPSFYEGFGLPILEAMACGTPVITSTTSSLPEVGGDAALYTDPRDINKLSQHMEALVRDERLRVELIEKGFRQVKKFKWYNSVNALLEVFQELDSK